MEMETWHRRLVYPSLEGKYVATHNSPETTSPNATEEATAKLPGVLFHKGTYVAASPSSQLRCVLPRGT